MRFSTFGCLLLAAATLTAAGCDKLTATVQAVSVVTRTPDIADAYGMDPLLVDALPQDPALQKVTAALVGVGERQSVTSTEAPTPVLGAQITVAWEQSEVRLCAIGNGTDGTYQVTSLTSDDCGAPTFDYVEGATYTTTIETDTAEHTLSIVAPPAIDATKVTFDPSFAPASDMGGGANLLHHPKNTALAVDWSADTAAADRPTFAVLARVNYSGTGPADALSSTSWEADPQNPIYDNMPRQPAALIDMVTQEPPTSLTLDGALFDTSGLYVLVLTSAELSTDTSASLSFGSGALAGYGTAFVFWVE